MSKVLHNTQLHCARSILICALYKLPVHVCQHEVDQRVDQRSVESSFRTRVKVKSQGQLKGHKIGRWAHINIKLLHHDSRRVGNRKTNSGKFMYGIRLQLCSFDSQHTL